MNLKKVDTTITKLQKDGKTITLCGVRHYGTEKYYDRIQDILDSHDNVLYEGIKKSTDKHASYDPIIEKFSDKQKRKFRLTKDNVFQLDYLKYKDSWVNSDLSEGELNLFCPAYKSTKEILELLSGEGELKDIVKKNLKRVIKLVVDVKLRGDRGLIIWRNRQVMMDTINTLTTTDDVCVFYGDGHMKNFIKEFKTMGFKVINTTYLNPNL